MKRTALVVPQRDGESTRQLLHRAQLLVPGTKVAHLGERLAFAITAPPSPLPNGAEVTEVDFPEPPPTAPRSYRELLTTLHPTQRALLPRAFDVVGDVVVIRLPNELGPVREAVGRALLEFVPGARVVGWDRGVHGVDRRRSIERIAGEGGFATVHRENGIALELDLARAYFSPRLAREHSRVASEVGPRERVLDLCCGIGPFGLLIAHSHPDAEVFAVDQNPDAVELLERNARRLGVESRVHATVADVERFLAEDRRGNRAILNLPHEGIKYLPSVAARVEPGGTLHYYEMSDREQVGSRASQLLGLLAPIGGWTARTPRSVHPYSPRDDLVAYTLLRSVR